MAKTKSTKKFEGRHLKDTLKKRKDDAKVKQRTKLREKKKTARRAENGDNEEEAPKPKPSKGKELKEMTVDEFFQGGFEVPEKPGKKRKRGGTGDAPSKKRAKAPVDETSQDDESEDDSDAPDAAGGTVENAADDESDESEEDEDEDAHKKQLESLAEKDPEFYKYLKENDAELLDFEDGDLAEIDQLSDEEEAEEPKKEGKDKTLTLALVNKWEASMTENKSLRTARELVLAFRAAAHLNENNGKEYKYTVTNSDAYNKVLVLTLKGLPELLQHHLPIKETASGKINLSSDSKVFKTLAPMVKSHIASVLHLLSNLSDGSTLRLTLASILALLPYALPYRKVLKEMGKSVVIIWAESSSDDATKISAFLVLRKLIVIGDAGLREAILKATYQGLIKGCRSTTIHTIQGINLMKNSAAELWGIDPVVGYTTGFGFIRQLALHLRSTITNKTKDSYKVVYNWQCVHSLDFWSRVLAQNSSSLREAETGKDSPLRPLIYPTVQVTLGVLRLIPTAQYFPLRFQLCRSLLRICRATNTFIPLAPALLEVLNSAEMRKAPKPTTIKALDFSTSIRAGKTLLRTRVYQDGVGEQVVELFSEFFMLWCKSIAFPELALPVIVMLKRWLKTVSDKGKGNKNNKLNTSIGLFIQKLEANAKWIESKRARVDYAPNNRSAVERFLSDEDEKNTPLGAFVLSQRKMREQKEALLKASRQENGHSRNDDQDEDDSDNAAMGELSEGEESPGEEEADE
ncbi:nucleolar complex protein [Microthyrium microscopicum]|uniref:Nucleolar complex protein n=1 Tax=Microthyrium microscopicum TaxID=703497 RepID=A0A6A6UAF7_9PEZI|nr:nucleolar complex protein [Microthyrium microscopicum]